MRCRQPRHILIAACAVLAGVAGSGDARAQALTQTQDQTQSQGHAPAQSQPPSYDVLSPSLDYDPRHPPYFQRAIKRPSRAPASTGQIPTFGMSSGAGSTGFNSANAPPTAPSTPSPSSSPTAAQLSGAPPGGAPSPDADALPITVPIDQPIAPADAALLVPPPDDGTGNPVVRPRKRKRIDTLDPYDPVGVHAGSFILKPALELIGGYHSNPGEIIPPKGSSVFTVAPELQAQSIWSEHELRANLRGSYTTYPGFDATPSLNRPLIDSKVNARIDVSHQTKIDLESRFLLTTEDPNNPNLPAGLKTLPVTMSNGVTAGVRHAFNRLELGVQGSFDRIAYADSQLVDGETINNADQNYNQYGLKLRGSYDLLPGVKPFVEVGGDSRVHDLPVDSFGLHRDSVGEVASVGTTFEITRQLVGTTSVGYATRHYQDPTLPDLGGLVADGSLAWSATALTTLTFTARSTAEESILPGVSGSLNRDFGVQADHAFRQWLIGTLKFGYGWSDYVGSTREDQRYAAGAQLTYKMSRDLWLKGEIRHEWQTSNVLSGNYAANIFLLGIRLQR